MTPETTDTGHVDLIIRDVFSFSYKVITQRLDVTMDTSHLVLLLLMLLHCAKGFNCSCVKIIPDSSDYINVEVGTNFTAICYLQEGSGFTSNDIKWNFKGKSDKELFYLKINETSASVTVNISRDMSGWLLCEASRESLTYLPQCSHGIFLQAGYPPLKPKNLTCIAEQENDDISPDLTCYWEPGSRDPQLKTNYTIFAKVELEQLPPYEATCIHPLAKSCTVNLSTFPLHMQLKVWVEVKNELGSERSDELERFSLNFVKPNPPLDVRVLAEVNFSTTLMVVWKHPLHEAIMKLSYAIRYCQVGSCVWTKVPENLTSTHTESYRLQSLEPYTEYVVQMRSIGERRNTYWSDWSPNATVRTPEAKPASAPDLWRISQSTSDKREVTLFWKPPVKANGVIVKYHLEIIQDNQTIERTIITADMPSQPYYLEVPSGETAYIELEAVNSAGVSPKATLFIPRSKYEFHSVKNMSWWVHDAKLHVKWSAVSSPIQGIQISEYLLDWMNVEERQPQWLRVAHNVTTTILTGNLTKFKRYNISVYPIYKYRYQRVRHIQSGTPVTMQAYIQQGAPTYGPTYRKPIAKKNSAVLNWNKIPVTLQNGFIRNYTIFYKAGNDELWQFKTVAADIYSYELTGLVSESDYEVRIMASTDAGSTNSSNYNFKTMKYGDGEVEVIVVVVCLSFLFLSVFIIMLCLRKREVIKKLLWPQVPDPSDSSIAHWSPDFPVKADVPKEDVSVVEVDVFDGKSLCEEDKVVLPLKKDKYLSDEHSSGIGGSSCMSSPRHSVSDSDEGDSGQTTASTVQYSSVVASGYKGQTPSHQPPAFTRSESTQPLLDCEEHPEHLSERNSYFRRGRELEAQNTDEPTFCAVQEEEMSPVVDDKPALSYMPQQSGYRPQ